MIGDADTRFWAKVRQEGDCWVWTAHRLEFGHGQFRINPQERILAHRYAYLQMVGPIPDGLFIDHLCRNPPCVNPDHLDPVPPAINSARSSQSTATHCPNGHAYTPENLSRPTVRYKRRCLTCRRDAGARSYAARKAAAA